MIPSYNPNQEIPPPLSSCAGCYAAGIFARSLSAGMLGGRIMALSGLLSGSGYMVLQRKQYSEGRQIPPLRSLAQAAFAWTASIGTIKLAARALKIEGALPIGRASAIGAVVELSGFMLKDFFFRDLRSCEEKAEEKRAFDQLRQYLLSRLDA